MTADPMHYGDKAINRDPFHGQSPAEMLATLGRIDNAIRSCIANGQSLSAIATFLEIPVDMVRERMGQLLRRGDDFGWRAEYGAVPPDTLEMIDDFG